ncbi:MAG: alpha/beta fold hydrolase [Vicinamibacterales bacterium]
MAFVETGSSRIHYSQTGSGPAVILVQGVGVIGNGWRPQVDALRDRYSLITIDNRGIGGSGPADAPLTIEDMAADVLAVADAAQAARFHLVGHSMGGMIAQQIALTARARVQSLALLCTFLKGRQGTMVAPSMLLTAVRSRVGTPAMRRRAFVELVMPRAYLSTVNRDALCSSLALLFGRDLSDSPPIVMRQLRAMGTFDASHQLSSLAGLPTLVVSAAQDCIARPAYGQALAAAIPGARYREFADAGHAVTIQQAEEISTLLAEHFSTRS